MNGENAGASSLDTSDDEDEVALSLEKGRLVIKVKGVPTLDVGVGQTVLLQNESLSGLSFLLFCFVLVVLFSSFSSLVLFSSFSSGVLFFVSLVLFSCFSSVFNQVRRSRPTSAS